MPFYGRTPAEAAHQLSDWLTRAYARAADRQTPLRASQAVSSMSANVRQSASCTGRPARLRYRISGVRRAHQLAVIIALAALASVAADAERADFETATPPAGEDRRDVARGQRRLHADGEDLLPQPRRRSRHPRVRVPAAERRGPRQPSRARLGARGHPRPSVRALHSLHPRSHRAGLRGDRAGVSRQHRVRRGVLRRDRLRRRAKWTTW